MGEWDWGLETEADKFLKDAVGDFRKSCVACAQLADRIEAGTSSRFIDWVDHMIVPAIKTDAQALLALGFLEAEECSDRGLRVFRHDRCMLFPVLLSDEKATEVAIRVEDISEFQKMNGLRGQVLGSFNAPLRRLEIHRDGGHVLSSVERRGSAGFVVPDAKDLEPYDAAFKTFMKRRRDFTQDVKGLDDLERHVVSDLDWLDRARVADAFFRSELRYWESRNAAARIQRARQNALGLGCANIDHFTIRSSRRSFRHLLTILGMMGLEPRERFFAGMQAGWGAQVLEQRDAGLVVFVEVDLAPDETGRDFASTDLPDAEAIGTVGLWTALHGESVLQSGPHHVALRLDFERSRRDLRMKGVETMRPFSLYSFLKQCLTRPEIWEVNRDKVEALERSSRISTETGARFISQGALGSHLEIVQRDQGFKGFNQDSVSAVMRETDPRSRTERSA